ncbi:TetR/AcrR family transcriptional regulator [Paenalkalicoccus suaedae]|uniref:TetR/AcrR family transcriptional regulator n=1 Tax=Paenalkalicoccus suaedae TaxID=2592382 RepID=A0A859FD22_9BACI|nr:TetR/AcrR family transcriptional regulator [Paenalkalicoccus suaedae]QKS70116.1 TetR/AcrR family transcriptional regulator [Paenalkalicoccus suaedae]
MARHKTIDQLQIFTATEELILESGYAGFHFKSLSEKLGVARSTIYNYYTNKEELVTDFMLHMLQQVVTKMDTVHEHEEPIRAMMGLWAKYANMHQMLQIMPYIDRKASPKVEQNAKRMFIMLEELRNKIEGVVKEEQRKGNIRQDVQLGTLVSIIMSTVQVPVANRSEDEWTNDVFNVLMQGLKA